MKLKNILSEIGDGVEKSKGAKFFVSQSSGNIKFGLDGLNYHVSIRLIDEINEPPDLSRIVSMVDFNIENEEEYRLTGKHNALRVMANLVGNLENWFKLWKKKYNKNNEFKLIYIKFIAQKEEGEIGNKRATVYKKFIEKFAQRHNTIVKFSGGTNEVIATFDKMIL